MESTGQLRCLFPHASTPGVAGSRRGALSRPAHLTHALTSARIELPPPQERRERSIITRLGEMDAASRHNGETPPGVARPSAFATPTRYRVVVWRTRTIRARLEVVVDVVEDRSDLRAKQDKGANNHNGDKSDDKRVLDESLAAITAKHTIQHGDSPCASTIMRRAASYGACSDHLYATRHPINPHQWR